jgi:SAM-dependent methyltransferase
VTSRTPLDELSRLELEPPYLGPSAAFDPSADVGGRIVTPTAPWAHAVGFPLSLRRGGTVFALVTCRRGEIGIGVLAKDGSTLLAPEAWVSAGETRLVRADVDADGEAAHWLMVRNGAGDGPSECELLAAFTGTVPSVDLTDATVALALRDPAKAHASCVTRAWPDDVVATVGAADVPLRVRRPEAPLRPPPPRTLWSGPQDAVVLGAAEDLVELLEQFRAGPLERHLAVLPTESMRAYLRMNVVRVVRLVELLRSRGVDHGSVLEVGAWFGSFALALRRLGYEVVACDRYSSYGDAFSSYIELMEREGIRIVSTNREGELDQIAGLGQFDIVLAGAVIEHVPHTPRHLLERLFAAVRPGGLLLLDTPNIARYWNRRALEQGETVFQPIEDQYPTDPPWEGHHREYTAAELEWMLERVGCDEVVVEFVDYNMLQFDELSDEHIECLASIVEDPSQADTLLAAGRRPLE